jgi:hypothetical protein
VAHGPHKSRHHAAMMRSVIDHALQPEAIGGEYMDQRFENVLVSCFEIPQALFWCQLGRRIENPPAGPFHVIDVQAKSIGGYWHTQIMPRAGERRSTDFGTVDWPIRPSAERKIA